MSANVSKASASTLLTISALETRAWVVKLVSGALIGAFVGAIVGALFFSALRSERTAMAFIRVTPPADLPAIAGNANQVVPDTSDNPEKYVAGEVAYLGGEGFSQLIGKKLGKSEAALLKVAQEARSPVISIGSSAPTADEATRTVQAALDTYAAQRAQRVDEQMRIILPMLDQWEQNDATNTLRVGIIQQLRESVQLQSAAASTLEVLQPPTLDPTSNLRWAIGLLLGAFGGGGCTAVVLMARKRRAGRGSVVATVAEAVDAVLVPAVDLRLPPRSQWDASQISLARTLYSQCPSVGPGRTIVVLGISETSGTGEVASLLESAASEAGLVKVVTATGDSLPELPEADERATLIVAAGGLGQGKLTPEAIRLATDVVIVARVDTDTVLAAAAACSAAAAGAAPVAAIFTHRSWKWEGLPKRKPSVGAGNTGKGKRRRATEPTARPRRFGKNKDGMSSAGTGSDGAAS